MSVRFLVFLLSLAVRVMIFVFELVLSLLLGTLRLLFGGGRARRRRPRRARGSRTAPRVRLRGRKRIDLQDIYVIDGDTVSARLPDGTPVRIRIYGIDAPESDQHHGPCATLRLSHMVRGARLKALPIDTDRYGRLVARLIRTEDGLDVGRAMVTSGFARATHRYTRRYVADERRARAARRGLWGSRIGMPDPAAHRAAQRG